MWFITEIAYETQANANYIENLCEKEGFKIGFGFCKGKFLGKFVSDADGDYLIFKLRSK